ncbi:MAG: DUF1521 domain-containing protein [Planctomycetota bacterium]
MTAVNASNMNSRFHRAAGVGAPQLAESTRNDALKRNGNTIDTGRYDVTIVKDEVKIFDKDTNTWVKAWGDPHLNTSDGDATHFHYDNLTIDLPDGTKVTISPTEVNANGVSWVDKVAIMKGDQAIVVENVHGSGAIQFGPIADNAALVDQLFADGTVLRAGAEVDDLHFVNADGKETELAGDLLVTLDDLGGYSALGVNADAEHVYADLNGLFDQYDRLPANASDEEVKAITAQIDQRLERIGGIRTAGGSTFTKMEMEIAGLQKKLDRMSPEDPGYSELAQKLQRKQQALDRAFTLAFETTKKRHDLIMALLNNL